MKSRKNYLKILSFVVLFLISSSIYSQTTKPVSRSLYGDLYVTNLRTTTFYEDNSTPTIIYDKGTGTYDVSIIKIGRTIQDDSNDGDNIKQYYLDGMGYIVYDLTKD